MSTTTDNHTLARAAGLVAVPALIGAGVLTLALSLRGRLPDPLAVHFGVDGAADGYLGAAANLILFIALMVVLIGLSAWIGVPRRRPAAVARQAAAVCVGVAVLVGGVFAVTLITQRDLVDATAARLELWWLPVLIVVASAAGAVTFVLMPSVASTVEVADPDAPRLPLEPGVRAVWVRRQRMAGLFLLLPALLLAGTVLGYLVDSWLPAVVLAAVGAVVAALGSWTVTVDGMGLHYRAELGLPRRTVPLERMVDARVIRAHPLRDAGGWGIRVNRHGGTGLYLRAGQALQVRTTDAGPVVITVDDATTAAGLLNALADRTRPGVTGR